MRTFILLLLTLVAFASNSLLNRAALAEGQIDWASFTIIRLVAGAVLLGLIFAVRHGSVILPRRDGVVGALSLFVYALAFSAAYINLNAGIGALILFPAGQISMQIIGLTRGIIPSKGQLVGAVIAFAGLIVLVTPAGGLSADAPPLGSALLMALAGIAWGFYSWAGKLSQEPELGTARNFFGAAVLALLLLPFVDGAAITLTGIVLAIISGAITSALGYILWYRVLAKISITNAAVAQLSVPAIAALGGAVLLDEILTLRILAGGLIIFAGIGLSILASRQSASAK